MKCEIDLKKLAEIFRARSASVNCCFLADVCALLPRSQRNDFAELAMNPDSYITIKCDLT